MTSNVLLLPDHPIYADAISALKQYNEAKVAGTPSYDLEQLRCRAEFLFQAVTDYQMKVLVQKAPRQH